MMSFTPHPPLIDGVADRRCRAVVIVPARNEAMTLAKVLDRLAEQRDERGQPISPEGYEVLLLLNNCVDDSGAIAREAVARHATMRLRVIERALPTPEAHVGTARRLLMDTAWHRLRHSALPTAILSTDADTLVAHNWISENMRALARGADAVGGEICWMDGELAKLARGVQLAYARDQHYQRLLAALEDRLNPLREDPMPRHLHHFGASLACTPEIYARAGGLPVQRSLEDVAFVRALDRIGARLRHEPRVRVYTSGRLEGRVDVGLSEQLRTWQQMFALGEPHIVSSAAWSAHRLRMLRWLRCFATGVGAPPVAIFPIAWRARLLSLRQAKLSCAAFLDKLPSEQLIAESFRGERLGEIVAVTRELEMMLRTEPEQGQGKRAPTEAFSASRGLPEETIISGSEAVAGD